MSYLAHALTEALRELEMSQTDFARAARIDKSQVNRAIRGTMSVGREMAEAITAGLPEPHSSRAIVGWLRDQLTDERRPKIEIYPAAAHIEERPVHTLPPELTEEVRELLIWYAHKTLQSTAVVDSLRSFRRAVEAN